MPSARKPVVVVAGAVGAVLGSLLISLLAGAAPRAFAASISTEDATAGGERRTLVQDGATQAWSVLPPGNGDFMGPTTPHRADQVSMYDGLDDPVAAGTLTDADLPRYFKDARLGVDPADVERTERPGDGVEILWDHKGVPHVFGDTSEDVAYGAGWATGAARFIMAEIIRTAGRRGALELAGGGLSALFSSSGPALAYTEEELAAQIDRACAAAADRCDEILGLLDAYVAGINAWIEANLRFPEWLGFSWPRWRRTDVVASAITMGVIFGQGGGNETRNGRALHLLVDRFGPAKGRAVWDELRLADDPDANPHVSGTFPYPLYGDGAGGVTDTAGNVVDPASVALLDDETTEGAPPSEWWQAPRPDEAYSSNFLVVSGSRTESGAPVLAGGPQMGYIFPSPLFEIELQGGGYRSTGMTIPGFAFFVIIGHNDEGSWSITSGGSDLVDERVELLCEPDGAPASTASTHYVFDGRCVPMERAGERDVAPRTVHGPVTGHATVEGSPVAITSQRASRGFEALSALPFLRLNHAEIDGPADFPAAMREIPFTLNMGYASADGIAYAHTGRFPIRSAGADADLPTWGTGEWEWRGFLDWSQQPHEVDPDKGWIASWNNDPARGWHSSDSRWGHGAYFRVTLLEDRIAGRTGLTTADVIGIVQDAATADLRGDTALAIVLDVLEGTPAPHPGLEQVRSHLRRWIDAGAHRRDRDRNAFADTPVEGAAAAIVDELVEPLVAVTLGPLVGDLAEELPLPGLDNAPSSGGSAFAGGQLAYLVRDLTRLERGEPFACGNGDPAACRAALWDALGTAYGKARLAQLPFWRDDLSRWTTFVGGERILFLPLMLDRSMRWSNRATFSHAESFG